MKLFFLHVFFLFTMSARAQRFLDSLLTQLHNTKEDTEKINTIGALAQYYSFVRFDSSLYYANQAIDLAEKSNYPYGIYLADRSLFFANNVLGNYPKALEWAFKELRIATRLKNHRLASMGEAHSGIGILNREMENYPEAIAQLKEAILLQKASGEPVQDLHYAFTHLAVIFLVFNRLDSALIYAQKGVDLCSLPNKNKMYSCLDLAVLGTVEQRLGNNQLAEKYLRLALEDAKKNNIPYLVARLYNNLAGLFKKMNKPDSCSYYARASLDLSQKSHFGNYALDASKVLMQLYESVHNRDSVLKYLNLMLAIKDTVFNQQKVQQFELLTFDEKQRQQEIEAARERYQNQVRFVALLASLGIFLLIAFILYRNNRLQKKAKSKIESAYRELKSTQAQLIQSEKMASLGELTAGIAHEIQNPLNFVNNFSEVSEELIDEMQQSLRDGQIDEALALSGDIKTNLEKITQHGKRADAIVKGMLQHSRTDTGEKSPADLNALIDEYLRLSYHGMRAKNSSFNAAIQTNFDNTVGEVNIVTKDIGRVLLNLFSNSFYSLGIKQFPAGVQATLWASTQRKDKQVEIRVKDNGMGIPQNIIDKIFQPFYTTKPTGQGTGLGLSLTYDIITKEHFGTIKVESVQGEFAEFIIQLPIKSN
ncbi:MAG TPA: ATP-binding protein [Puia sp.]|nr:ATP-binding protein [Puia sp.]